MGRYIPYKRLAILHFPPASPFSTISLRAYVPSEINYPFYAVFGNQPRWVREAAAESGNRGGGGRYCERARQYAGRHGRRGVYLRVLCVCGHVCGYVCVCVCVCICVCMCVYGRGRQAKASTHASHIVSLLKCVKIEHSRSPMHTCKPLPIRQTPTLSSSPYVPGEINCPFCAVFGNQPPALASPPFSFAN